MKSKNPTRTQLAIRFRRARGDASIGAVTRTMEDLFGLPEGCLMVRRPDGRKMRIDGKVRTLRAAYDG